MSAEKSPASHHVEDLSVLARRGALSAAEQQVLSNALQASSTLSTAHQLGLDFEQIAAVKPGDDALIAEVAARVVNLQRPASFGRFRLRALLLVATLTLAGSAAAFWQIRRAPDPSVQAQTQPSPAAQGAPPQRRQASATPARPPVELTPPSEPAAPLALVHGPGNVPGAPSPRADAPPERIFDSAQSLFREANAARRASDAALARALYLRLERDFPASDEARLAHVSLGNLLLSMGRAGEAERQFASYQGGHAAQEALVGRAQSLAALGRSAEERRIWEGLLRDYPGSVYASRARQRLAELGRSTVGPQ